LQQRYAAEAQAGAIAADVILSAGDSSAFAAEGLKGGWIVPVTEAGIGAIKDGSFPASFLRGASAVVQIQPWVLTYNSDRVTGADVPKDWLDILKPRFAGQIIYSDPIISDAYLDHWVLMLDLYGPEFFAKLKALNPRKYVEGVAAAQSLAAGEGIIQFPVTPPQILDVKRRGAPLEIVIPATATGVEIQLIVSNPAKAKHPASGRLFADWLCSREGNAVLNADPGIAGVYDASALPKNYVPAKAGIVARKDEMRRLLGFIA
jgi:iron(III) transport system substrate-binding protein